MSLLWIIMDSMHITDAVIDRAAEAAFRTMYPEATGKPEWDKWDVINGPPKGLKSSVKDKWRAIARAALDAAQSAALGT